MNRTNNEEVINLKDLVLGFKGWMRYILSKWYFFVVAVLFGGSIGFYYAKSQKAIYTASTTFVLESGEGDGNAGGQIAGLAALAGVNLGSSGGGIFQGDNLFELYKSRKMIEATLLLPSASDSSLLIWDRYLIMTDAHTRWKEHQPDLLKLDLKKPVPPSLMRSRDSLLQKAVLDINKNYLVVGKLDKKSSLIKIDVNSTDEIFSKEFNEALVAQVNDFYVKTKTKKSLDNIAILQHKTDSVRAVMNGNITTNAVTIDVTPNLNPTRQAQRLIPTQRSQFSAETNKAMLSQMMQNLELSKMALMKESPLIQKVDEPVFPLLVERASALKTAIVVAFIFAFLTFVGLLLKKWYTEILKN
ncbi:lipopolysaccharide biosynthesis protein [Sphingobacterium prati]|uniref:lipopolysaccharide biosynthesis protein n=1 Tax=Sphingobacterium prati TaxID=2737006 RepID=UPI001552F329|nr:lipopolysaccharide biosynthesis protein [Sphingobacterium prati]NPE45846.1 lipopolysaccharide biosynthesis protein [Sphingobacterium prati]